MTSIRAFTLRDTESVIALWQSTGLTKSWNNPHLDIQRKLTLQPELFLVATDADEIIGTVMAGYDGHRGWLYYLASDPMRRGQGIGRALVSAAEELLLELVVTGGNCADVAFLESLPGVQEVLHEGQWEAEVDVPLGHA